MPEKVKVWFDPEGDFLEVQFSEGRGFMRRAVRAAAGGMSYLLAPRAQASGDYKTAANEGSLVRLVPVFSVFFCARMRYHTLK